MKRLSVISLTLLSLLTALLVGCGGSHDARITAVLDRADSLLRTNDTAAHSAALRQMLVLDTARALQADEALRARHALLLVQARYKCYVTIPADSALIDQARRYYADHHGSATDHERYTRALIFSGAVAEELGHPQQAMQHYLEAESTADPNDHFNLGYTNLRMAVLLSSLYASDASDMEHYRKALYQFTISGERHFQGICLGNIGGLIRFTDNYVAKPYLYKGIELMKEMGDSTYYFDFIEMLAVSYMEDSCFEKAEQILAKCFNSDIKYRSIDVYLTGAQIYAYMNDYNKSLMLINQSKQFPYTARDSLKELYVRATIATNQKQFNEANALRRYYNEDLKRIKNNSDKKQITNVEKGFVKQTADDLQKKSSKFMRYLPLISLMVFLVLFLVVFLLLKIRYNNMRAHDILVAFEKEKINEHKELLSKINEYSQDLQKETQKNKELEKSLKDMNELRSFLLKHVLLMKELLKIAESSNKEAKFIKKEKVNKLIKSSIATEDFWRELELFVNETHNELITYLKNHHPKLNKNDIRLISLLCSGFSYAEIALLMNIKKDYVSVRRSRTIRKIGIKESFNDFVASFRS